MKREKYSNDAVLLKEFLKDGTNIPEKHGLYKCLVCGFQTGKKMTRCWRCGSPKIVYAPPVSPLKRGGYFLGANERWELVRMWER